MDTERSHRLRAAMGREGVDLLALRMPDTIAFLTGFLPLNGPVLLLVPREGLPVCIVPGTEEREAAAALDGVELAPYPAGTLTSGDAGAHVAALLARTAARHRARAIATDFAAGSMGPAMNAAEPLLPGDAARAELAAAWPGASFVDGVPLLDGQRARKTPGEAARVRLANEAAALGLEAFAAAVQPGVSGIELAAEVERAILLRATSRLGARYVRSYAQVATGVDETAAGFRPFELTTRRRMEPGDLALLELAVCVDGAWSDRTRARAAGAPSELHRQLFDAVLAAQDGAVAAVRPGAKAGAVDAAARSVMEKAGFGAEFFHVTGHGTGFRYHEPTPLIAPGSATVLEEGMVFSVEPGAYSPRFGGLRLEDNVLVTATGAEVLGPAERKLSA